MRGGVAIAGVWIVAGVLLPAARGQTDAPEAITSLEEQLWREVTALNQPAPPTLPYEAWFGRTAEQCAGRLRAVQAYLTLYPGGAHCEDALRIELATLFDLAILRGESLGRLANRAAEVLHDPPSDAARDEAAFWLLSCERAGVCSASQPTSPPAVDAQAARIATARHYVERCPNSRLAPRLAELVFEDALVRDDRDTLRYMADLLAAHFPHHAIAQRLLARLRLEDMVGVAFPVRLTAISGQALEAEAYRGQPLLIVVWAGFDETARECAVEVEQFRRQHPDVQVIGIGLDEKAARTAEASQALGLPWPQANDGRGWGGEFVSMWGLWGIPRVLVIDRAGRLLGVRGAGQWRPLALAALAETASQPARDPGPATRPAVD